MDIYRLDHRGGSWALDFQAVAAVHANLMECDNKGN